MLGKTKDFVFGCLLPVLILALIFGFIAFCSMSLREWMRDRYVEDHKPENLNIFCQEYSESYYNIVADDANIPSISREDAYKIKLAIQGSKEIIDYEKMLDFWTDVSNDDRREWASEGDNPTIIISHTIDHSCEPYWNYKNVVEPELNRIIDASPAKTTL